MIVEVYRIRGLFSWNLGERNVFYKTSVRYFRAHVSAGELNGNRTESLEKLGNTKEFEVAITFVLKFRGHLYK